MNATMRLLLLGACLLVASCTRPPTVQVSCPALGTAASPEPTFVSVSHPPSATATAGPDLRVVATTNLPGQQNSSDIVVDTARQRIYVLMGSGPLVTVDAKTNAVIGSLDVGSGAEGMAIDPRTGRLYVYVSLQTSNSSGGSLAVLDGATNKLVTTIAPSADARFGPGGVVVNPKTGCVYNGDFSSSVAVVDAATNALRGSLDVGGQPIAVAVDPEANRIFVATAGPINNIVVIDGASNRIAKVISGFDTPRAIAADPRTGRVYLTHGMETLTILDGAAGTVRKTMAVMNRPESIAVDATAGRVYVANVGAGTVSIIDNATELVVGTAMVAQAMGFGIAVDSRTGRVYTEEHIGPTHMLKVFER